MGKIILPRSWQDLAKILPTPRTMDTTHPCGTSLSNSTLVVLKHEVPLPKTRKKDRLIDEGHVLTMLKYDEVIPIQEISSAFFRVSPRAESPLCSQLKVHILCVLFSQTFFDC